MIKIAINGFGRIGRLTCRHILGKHPNLKIAAINDLADKSALLHLFRYDSVYGLYEKNIKGTEFLGESDPAKLPWKKMGIDIVLECTGAFRDLAGAKKHIVSGAKQVIISAPAKDDDIPSFILGINEKDFNVKKDSVCDMGSCTTNCAAQVAKILNDNFKIINGFLTTIHGYTTTQRILDAPHKDLRRARAAGLNIIPTTTGASKAVGRVLPALKGRLGGVALRVPVPTVSILDFVCQVAEPVSVSKVNQAFARASEKELKGILAVSDEPLVSTDYIGQEFSAVIDKEMTMTDDDLVKVLAWYDNEYAYACRLAEFAEYVGKQL